MTDPKNDPATFSLLTYIWVFGLSSWGGAVSFYRKWKDGNVRAFNLVELVGELFTSAFAGVITFLLCHSSNFDPLMTAALVGISGHAGSRTMFHLEKYLASKFPVPGDHSSDNSGDSP